MSPITLPSTVIGTVISDNLSLSSAIYLTSNEVLLTISPIPLAATSPQIPSPNFNRILLEISNSFRFFGPCAAL